MLLSAILGAAAAIGAVQPQEKAAPLSVTATVVRPTRVSAARSPDGQVDVMLTNTGEAQVEVTGGIVTENNNGSATIRVFDTQKLLITIVY